MLKIGIDSFGWYDMNDPQGSLEYIRSCGFESVDLGMYELLDTGRLAAEGHYPNVFDLPLEEFLEKFMPLRLAVAETGVVIGQMHAPFPIWFDGREDVNAYNVQAVEKCMALCELLGCPALVVHPSRRPGRRAEFELNLENYRGLIPVAIRHPDVIICAENIFTHSGQRILEGRLSNPDDACELIDTLNAEAGGRHFGFCLDIGHACLTGNKIGEFIRQLGDRLTALHIHDNDGLEDLHMVPYSYLYRDKRHVIDWEDIVRALGDIGFRGALSFEICTAGRVYPAEVRREVYCLTSAIGRYWRGLLTE